jgi:hypothetical protein
VKNIFNRIISNKKVLHSAVLNNDIIGVQNALHNCEDVNEVDSGGRSPQHLALALWCSCVCKYTKGENSAQHIIQLLLRHNADVNIRDMVVGWTLFQYAEQARNILRTVKMLLKHGTTQGTFDPCRRRVRG